MTGSTGSAALPVIDVGPLVSGAPLAETAAVAEQIQAACREHGFFYVTGHGAPAALLDGWYRSTPHRVRNLSGHGRLQGRGSAIGPRAPCGRSGKSRSSSRTVGELRAGRHQLSARR